MLGAEIFALCKTRNRSIEELTKKIYGNLYSKNIVRVYQVMKIFMENELLIPKFKNKILTFEIKGEK